MFKVVTELLLTFYLCTVDPNANKEDVLLLYDSKKAFPTSNEQIAHDAEYNDGDIPIIDATTATGKKKGVNMYA